MDSGLIYGAANEPEKVAVLRSKVSQRSPAVNAMYEQMVRTLGG